MKLTLVQKFAIIYYTTKIKITYLLSKEKAVQQTFNLFCTPYSGRKKRVMPPIFQKANTLSFLYNRLTIRGWQWLPINNNKKTILILHGFDSCSYSFESYIQPLSYLGYTVLAFDAPAHGLSDGKTVTVLDFKNVVITINRLYGNIHTIIAHSFGGLCAALTTTELIELKKLVLIAPAIKTTRAIDSFFNIVQLGEIIKQDLIQYIEKIAQKKIDYFSTTNAVANSSIATLWVHDKDDFICPYEDLIELQEKNLPHIQFHITENLGHNKIYKTKKVKEKIIKFIEA